MVTVPNRPAPGRPNSNKRTVIAVVVTAILSVAGTVFGLDLSGWQKPAEQAVGVGVDAAEQALKDAQKKR